MSVTHASFGRTKTVVDGGAAGAHTVTGIKTRDRLVSVIHLEGSGTALTGAADLTAEFTITAADTIDNTGGTVTTNGVLIVEWDAADDRGGDLNRS